MDPGTAMVELPHMLMIGSTGSNVGKTELACDLIRTFRHQGEMVGIKVTTIHERGGECPRGGEGCGVCSTLEENYCITEERNARADKDTSRLLAAGAQQVFWLRVLREHLEEGLAALMKRIPPDTVIICESNSLRLVAEPGIFLVVRQEPSSAIKSSCTEVIGLADRIVLSGADGFGLDLDDISLSRGNWRIRLSATALIMAGGKSARMGRNKSMLPLDGIPLIVHILDQLRPCFREIYISANDPDTYAHLGVDVIPDEVPGEGPLMGILSSLEASSHDCNFVVACDVPVLRYAFIRKMVHDVEGYDAVIPMTGKSRYEPLFAVYRKSMIAPMREVFEGGARKISDVFEKCRINFIDMSGETWYRNLNTIEEYTAFRDRRQ